STPVGCVGRLGFQSSGDNLLDVFVAHRTRGTRSRFVGQSIEPLGHEPVAPRADRCGTDTQLLSHDRVARLVGTGQDDPAAEGQALSTLRSVGPPRESQALVVGQHQLGFWPCHTASVFSKAVANGPGSASTRRYVTNF